MILMEKRILEIINYIRNGKGLPELSEIKKSDILRDDIGFTSFDLAELTVRIEDEFDIDIFEDGLVSSVGDLYERMARK